MPAGPRTPLAWKPQGKSFILRPIPASRAARLLPWSNPVHTRTIPSLFVGIVALFFLAGTSVLAPAVARADLKLESRETSWSVAGQGTSTVILRTHIQGSKRRLENGSEPDSAGNMGPLSFIQIDRVDSDTSYFVRPVESAYLAVPMARVRDTNRGRIRAFLEARQNGTAPADTLAPIRITNLHRKRRILGVDCDGVVVELSFQYRDTTSSDAEMMTGMLSDTVWLAPPGGPLDELIRFEKQFAQATLSDSFLAAPTDIQLSQWRGQGLTGVVQRAVRGLPGYPLATSFVNLLIGIPKHVAGVERRPDGAVVVQRARREPLALSRDPLTAGTFDVPDGLRRAESGARQTP